MYREKRVADCHRRTIADQLYGITQQVHGVSTRVPVRFDVLSVYLVTDKPEFEHMAGAFPYREPS